MKTQKGFTLIELIIVIVVLGILAVTAAPQFVNFSGDARESTLDGLKGAMNGAGTAVYAKASIAGKEDDADDGAGTPDYQTVTVDSTAVEIVYGYPAATVDGIVEVLEITTGDWDIRYENETDVTTPGTVKFSPAGLNSPNTNFADITDCFVSYAEATATAPPTITVDNTNC
ncbi:hypothetical protein IDSA_00105 [Pseudidiomarina salinarum]|uniref:MSHA biogenesis protein MshA n=1 Tax=Pseudidiomarina salinarum TaxID=435908 RepID=A0A094IVL5_9GAMM|nr:prepilin-type N-terminal cleavage/methylation domain-containing protein [Pseudidiomarina salinarum]KFZ31177.1 hypothetical protein IDSA_00105 [Pseudidiomarina salinarum]RUO71075.1 prepilin-type cleavage/methylation domain-containing protein [Pseudidiomarina salinarum]